MPEYENTMVISADHEEVPDIMFMGTGHELELVTAKDARDIVRGLNCDKRFSRVNKVCRGTANG